MTHTPDFLLRELGRLAACLGALPLVACRTAAPARQAGPTPLVQSHWVKVSSQPPTFYPRGVARDHPAGHDRRLAETVARDEAVAVMVGR